MKLLLATRSAHKVVEIRRILRDVPDLEVIDLNGAGIDYEAEEEDLEPYDTFEENALSKARYFHRKSGLPTVADDSGLVVDALGGAPGVRSKRFAPVDDDVEGEERDRANNEYLMDRLEGVPLPERSARYVCVAALMGIGDEDGAAPDAAEVHYFRGEAPGLILGRPKGWGGFGYDPLFFDETLGLTFAQIEPEQKNARSHRGRAFRALGAWLEGREEGG